VGTFYVDFVLWNLPMDRSRALNGLVDTGSTFPQVPASLLEEMGIERTDSMRFRLADGSRTELSLGRVMLELDGSVAPIRIVFGPEGGSILLGALALESFGLAADVSNRQLVPAEAPQ
jgi:predicted aspartyl protease